MPTQWRSNHEVPICRRAARVLSDEWSSEDRAVTGSHLNQRHAVLRVQLMEERPKGVVRSRASAPLTTEADLTPEQGQKGCNDDLGRDHASDECVMPVEVPVGVGDPPSRVRQRGGDQDSSNRQDQKGQRAEDHAGQRDCRPLTER